MITTRKDQEKPAASEPTSGQVEIPGHDPERCRREFCSQCVEYYWGI